MALGLRKVADAIGDVTDWPIVILAREVASPISLACAGRSGRLRGARPAPEPAARLPIPVTCV